MVNKFIAIGNLGRDPELRHTQTGKTVTNFSLAVQGGKTADGYLTEWIDVVCWEKLADNVVKFLSKGSKVYVEGRIATRKWEDKNGQERYTTECIAHEVKFLDPRPAADTHSSRHKPDAADDVPVEVFEVDDVPF